MSNEQTALPEWAWEMAKGVFADIVSEDGNGDDRETIARALVEAEKRGLERAVQAAENHDPDDGTGPDCDGCGEVIAERIRALIGAHP